MSPVHANQNSISTSYQPGTMSPMLPRCRKSVRMYGALGKKSSQTSAATTMRAQTTARREVDSVYASPAKTNGTQASARFQIRNQ